MRPIEFRLLLDGKIIGYEIAEFEELPTCYLHWRYYTTSNEEVGFLVHDTKEQFIGLKDKNEKKIYAKDVVALPDGFRYVVEWDATLGTWRFKGIGTNDYGTATTDLLYKDIVRDCLDDIEVIGTIHTNPELLKETS